MEFMVDYGRVTKRGHCALNSEFEDGIDFEHGHRKERGAKAGTTQN